MIVLDTCALIFDALSPEKLSLSAKKALNVADKNNQLFCSDISLWEVAMLIEKKRLEPGYEANAFLNDVINARGIQVLPITIEIALLSATQEKWKHFDPADRLIAATAMTHQAKLITCDKKLNNIPGLITIW